MKYVHKKTGNIYQVVSTSIINATNASDGQVMVLYHPDGNPDQLYVREYSEFAKKFQSQYLNEWKEE